jgi:hypothetical protein
MMPDALLVPQVCLFFSLCLFIYSLIIYLLFRFYLCFEAQVGLMAKVGGSSDKNRHKQCVWCCLCPRYVFFSSCFFNMLTNDLILAQGGLMTTVGAAAMKRGTNEISGRHRWCPNLSTFSFFQVFIKCLTCYSLDWKWDSDLYMPCKAMAHTTSATKCSVNDAITQTGITVPIRDWIRIIYYLPTYLPLQITTNKKMPNLCYLCSFYVDFFQKLLDILQFLSIYIKSVNNL